MDAMLRIPTTLRAACRVTRAIRCVLCRGNGPLAYSGASTHVGRAAGTPGRSLASTTSTTSGALYIAAHAAEHASRARAAGVCARACMRARGRMRVPAPVCRRACVCVASCACERMRPRRSGLLVIETSITTHNDSMCPPPPRPTHTNLPAVPHTHARTHDTHAHARTSRDPSGTETAAADAPIGWDRSVR